MTKKKQNKFLLIIRATKTLILILQIQFKSGIRDLRLPTDNKETAIHLYSFILIFIFIIHYPYMNIF